MFLVIVAGRLHPAPTIRAAKEICAPTNFADSWRRMRWSSSCPREWLSPSRFETGEIFLAQSGEGEVPKILDFGLAKFLVSTVNSAACYSRHSPRCADGTPQYMSPDHLKGDVASAVWDIWALAVITYEMLTGAHPFPAGSVGQTHYAIVSGGFTPLSTHLPDAPAEWQQFFERALSHQNRGSTAVSKRIRFRFGEGVSLGQEEHFAISYSRVQRRSSGRGWGFSPGSRLAMASAPRLTVHKRAWRTSMAMSPKPTSGPE